MIIKGAKVMDIKNTKLVMLPINVAKSSEFNGLSIVKAKEGLANESNRIIDAIPKKMDRDFRDGFSKNFFIDY